MTGESGFAMLKLGVWTARQGNYISDYDVVIGEKLANVLSGGRLTGEHWSPSSTCWIWSAKRF